ncbi:hypothetical protein F3Y22_tig00009942pilonHSYRG00029 [Hibiscus syriacus]|uniref:Uncharacterized protein n=1 Tax=Hibiscus syriacus TaxID=106335 RepID=A0A6A3CA18_HIBSY|nr:hypothetical protein F3Y22_tig00009942pilonHSYRG00029 [Hibiscus syriacus]
MDERFMAAARTGNVGDLYRLIRIDGNALRRFEEAEFADTPLHIATAEGHSVRDGDEEFEAVLRSETKPRRLKPDAPCGKSSKTPLHLICKAGTHDCLLDRFLGACPECVGDVTKDYYRKVVNQKDDDGNTALHMVASNSQRQMLKLRLDCKADKHATNQAGSTALDVAQQHNNRESIIMLRCGFIPKVSSFRHKLEKQIGKYVKKASSAQPKPDRPNYKSPTQTGPTRNPKLEFVSQPQPPPYFFIVGSNPDPTVQMVTDETLGYHNPRATTSTASLTPPPIVATLQREPPEEARNVVHVEGYEEEERTEGNQNTTQQQPFEKKKREEGELTLEASIIAGNTKRCWRTENTEGGGGVGDGRRLPGGDRRLPVGDRPSSDWRNLEREISLSVLEREN